MTPLWTPPSALSGKCMLWKYVCLLFYRIDIWSYLLFHMLDHMLEVRFFPLLLYLFNHLGFNPLQAGYFMLIFFGLFNLSRGCLFQLNLNWFFLSWFGDDPGCCWLFQMKGLGFRFGLRFGLLDFAFEGRPWRLEGRKLIVIIWCCDPINLAHWEIWTTNWLFSF